MLVHGVSDLAKQSTDGSETGAGFKGAGAPGLPPAEASN